MKASEIAKNTEIPRTRLYLVLENLQTKGLVFSTLERPAKFKALPLDRAVDFLIESYKHKLGSLEKAKESISHDWFLLQENEVIRNTTPECEENLQIISGEDQIYSKAKNLVMQAVKEVNVFVNARNLAKISYEDITDKVQLLASNGVTVKVLTNITTVDPSLLKEIDKCKIREIPPNFNDEVHFIIVDNRELLLLNLEESKVSAMWTDSRSIVDAMSFLFSLGWRASVYPTV